MTASTQNSFVIEISHVSRIVNILVDSEKQVMSETEAVIVTSDADDRSITIVLSLLICDMKIT